MDIESVEVNRPRGGKKWFAFFFPYHRDYAQKTLARRKSLVKADIGDESKSDLADDLSIKWYGVF